MSEGDENVAQLLASESAADSVTAAQPVSFQFEKLNTDDDHEYIPFVNVVDELIHDLVEEPVVSPHSHNSDGSPGAAPGGGRQLQATVSFNTGRRGSGTTNHSIGTTPSATSPLGHHRHHSETGGAIGSNRSPGVGSIRSTSTFNNKPSFATYEEGSESDDDTTTNSHRALGSASLAGNKYTVSSKALKKGVPTPTTTTTTTSATTTTSGTKGSRASADDEQKRLLIISPQGTASLASANFGSGSKLLRPSISIAEDIDPRTCASPKLAQNRPTGLRLMVPSANGGAPEIALQNSAIAGVYCTPEGEQALRNLVAAAAAQQIANMNVLTPQLGSALSGVTVDTTAGMWNGRDSMPTTPQEHYSRVMNSLPNTPFVTDGTPYYQTGYPGMPNFYQYQLQQQQQQKVPQSAKLKSPHSGAGNHSFVSVGSVANSADVGDLEGFNHHNPLSIIGDSHSSPHSGHWPTGQMHVDPHTGFSPADRYAAEYMQYHMMQQQQQQHQFMHPLYGNFNINSTISPPPPEHSLAQPLPTTATTNSNQQQPPAKTNNSSITLSDALETDEAPTERQVTGQFFEVAGGAATPSQQASRAPPPGYIGAPRLPPPGYNSVVPEYPDPLQVMKGETGPDVSGGQPRTQYGSGKGGATRLVSRFMPPPPPSLQAARVMAVCQGRGDAYYSRDIKNLDGQLKISPTHENIEELPSDPKTVAKTKADTISSLVMREHTVHNDGKTCVATGDFAFLTKTENTADWARAGYGPCYSATPTEGAPDTTFALFDTKSETFQAYLEVLMQWYARTVRAVGHNSPTHATAAQNPIGLHPSDSSITNLHNQSISIEDPMGASDATAAPAFGNSSSLSGSASNTKGSKLPSSYFALNNIPPCPRPEEFFEIDKERGDEEAESGEAKGLLVINDLDGFIKWNCAVHEWWSAQVQPRTIGYHLHLQQIRVQEGGGSQPNQQHHSQPHHQRESQQSQNSGNNTNGSRGGYNQNNRGGGRGGGGGSRGGAPSNHFTVQQQAPAAFNVPANYPPQYQPMYHAAPYGQPGMMMNPHHRQAPFGMPSANGYPQQPLPNNQQHPVSNWFQLVPQQRPDSQQLPW